MNNNKKVVSFVLGFTISLTAYSGFALFKNEDFLSMKRVNLLSSLFITPAPGTEPQETTGVETIVVSSNTQPGEANPVYRKADDSTVPAHKFMCPGYEEEACAFPALMSKLHEIKKGAGKKVRIAWMGDSMIEGDLLTQTFRQRLQNMFGGMGIGFVPISSVSATNRQTVKAQINGNWDDESFKTKKISSPIFLSGHTFFSKSGSVVFTDETVKDSGQILVKTLLCGQAKGELAVKVNGTAVSIHPSAPFNRIVLDSSTNRTLALEIPAANLPVYGVSMEPVKGVTVDNFSFRGSSGVELKTLDTAFLAELDRQHYYDLVVLQYGVNVLWKPYTDNYDFYGRQMRKILPLLRKAMPNTHFVIVGTADRAFLYDGEWKTAMGIGSLLKIQAQLAAENHMTFYNLFASMGGNGTIVKWAASKPALARTDYIHPTHAGAQKLGNMIFEDFISNYYTTDTLHARPTASLHR